MACHHVAGLTMNSTVTYWLMIAILCVFFPPLLGFIAGVGIFCGIWWAWIKVLGR